MRRDSFLFSLLKKIGLPVDCEEADSSEDFL